MGLRAQNRSSSASTSWQGTVGSGQIVGQREEQQDGYALGTLVLGDGRKLPLTVLADGMGGHEGGALAARVAIEAFLHHCSLGNSGGVPETLDAALLAANRAIASEAREPPQLRDMGCTLVATALDGQTLHYISVGDSPLWRVVDSCLDRLNADHSMAPLVDAAVARGEMREEEASPHRSGLRSALTGRPIALVDARSVELGVGDGVILASDGIFTLAEHDVAQIIQPWIGTDCQGAVDMVLDMVEKHAPVDQDNCTVVLFTVAGGHSTVERGRRPKIGSIFAIVAGLSIAALAAWQIGSNVPEDQPVRKMPVAAEAQSTTQPAAYSVAGPDRQGEAYK